MPSMGKECKSESSVDFTVAIIRVQSIIRGFIQRKKYKEEQSNLNFGLYFNQPEAKETLTKDKFNPVAPLVRRTHNYPSGAVYVGEWKGGMRFGKGLMIW